MQNSLYTTPDCAQHGSDFPAPTRPHPLRTAMLPLTSDEKKQKRNGSHKKRQNEPPPRRAVTHTDTSLYNDFFVSSTQCVTD